MSTETLKNIVGWCVAPLIVILSILGGKSCVNKQNAEREAKRIAEEQEYIQHLLSDKYIYKDINGVYHIANECGMLNDIYWTSDDEGRRGNYSSQYISRDSVKNWLDFAATHQLCSECFTPDLIRQLDSVCYYRKGRLSNPYWQREVETEDERYRDADEEYYNITNPREWRR